MAFILRNAARALEAEHMALEDEGTLRDVNGNTVGRWVIVGEEASAPETAEQASRRRDRTRDLATDVIAGLAMALGRRVTAEHPELAIDGIMQRAWQLAERSIEEGRG